MFLLASKTEGNCWPSFIQTGNENENVQGRLISLLLACTNKPQG